MRIGILTFAIIAVAPIGWLPQLFSQETNTLVGKRVMVIRWNAELKVGTKVVGNARLGSLFDVLQVNGDWLWIDQAGGWVGRRDVVLSERAIRHFSSVIGSNPTVEIYHQRAVAYAALEQFDKALADLNFVIGRDSRNPSALNDRGNVYRKLGQLKQAIADFDRAIASSAPHPAVYTNRGLVWHDAKNYDQALADFAAAIKLDIKFAPAWEAAGSSQQAKENYAKAIGNFKQAIVLDPKFVRAYNNLSWIRSTCRTSGHRNGKRAVEYALKACELTKFRDAGTLDTLAAALAEAGRFPEAIERATAAISLADSTKKTAIQERVALYKTGKPFRESR